MSLQRIKELMINHSMVAEKSIKYITVKYSGSGDSDRLTRAMKENNNKIDRDHDHAPEVNDEDSITVFKNKLAAFARAAEELDNAWDYVDGDDQVMNALRALDNEKIAWPFEKQLYYLALKDAHVWANIFASKLK